MYGGFILLHAVAGGPLTTGELRPTELQPAAPVVCLTCTTGQALLADAGPPAVAPDVVEVHDLATLQSAAAARLDGRWALFCIVIDGQGAYYVHEILPRDDPQVVMFLAGRPDADGVEQFFAQLNNYTVVVMFTRLAQHQ